jgi:hypothetical protein
MAADGFTTITRAMTVAEGEMFAELFRREGIDVNFHPMIGATIGSGEQICDLRIDVPIASEARVRELLSELEYVGTTLNERVAVDDDDAEPEAPAAPPRRPLLAAGVAFLFPGGGHFHARRPWTGLLVGTTLVCGWISSWGSSWRESFTGEMLFGSLIALVFVDAIAGRRAAMAENRGIHPGQASQFARGFVMVACAVAVGAVFATAAATPRWLEAREWRRIETRCTPRHLTVSNGDPKGRRVTVSALAVRTTRFSAGVTDYSVEPERSAQLEVIAGTAQDIHFALPDDVRELCVSGGCDLVFSVEARPLGDDKASSLKGEGVCPFWAPEGGRAGRIEPATAATE